MNLKTTNQFVEYQTVDGRQDAVIDTRANAPVDLTIDLQQVAHALNPPQPTSLGGTAQEKGMVDSTSTTWLDQKRGEVDRVTSRSNTNLTTTIQSSGALRDR